MPKRRQPKKSRTRERFEALTASLAKKIETEGAGIVARAAAQVLINLRGSFSPANVVMIAAQYPAATRVQGFRAWEKEGYPVRKGERAIWIFAPRFAKKVDGEGEDGEEEVRQLKGFITVPVFDIAQTTAPPEAYPTPDMRIRGAVDLESTVRAINSAIAPVELLPTSHRRLQGFYDPEEHRIVLYAAPDAVRLHTLLHEAAHALLHRSREGADTAQVEREAELTAYLVGRALGLDGLDEASAYYLSRYTKEPAELFEALKRSTTAAVKILEVVEGASELQKAA